MDHKKIISIVVALVLIANLALFAMLRYDWRIFWGVIAAGFLTTFLIRKKDKHVKNHP